MWRDRDGAGLFTVAIPFSISTVMNYLDTPLFSNISFVVNKFISVDTLTYLE